MLGPVLISPLLGSRGSEKTAALVGRRFPSVSALTSRPGNVDGEWRPHLPGKAPFCRLLEQSSGRPGAQLVMNRGCSRERGVSVEPGQDAVLEGWLRQDLNT